MKNESRLRLEPTRSTRSPSKKPTNVSLITLLAALSLLLSTRQAKAETLIVEIPPEPTNQPVAPGIDTFGSQSTAIATDPQGANLLAGLVLSPGSAALTQSTLESQTPLQALAPSLPTREPSSEAVTIDQPAGALTPPSLPTTEQGLVIISAPEQESSKDRRYVPGTPPGSAEQLLPAPQITAGSEAANLIITNSINGADNSPLPPGAVPEGLVMLPARPNIEKPRPEPVLPEKIDGTEQKPDDDLEASRQWIIQKGKEVAAEMNSTFKCAAGVQIALDRAGLPEFMGTGDGWEMRFVFQDSPKWRITDDPNKATAFVREWTPEVVASYGDRYQGRNLGHVGILYKENGRLYELSDHKAQFNPDSPRYSQTIYFEYVG